MEEPPSKKGKGERGIFTCKNNREPKDYQIEFDEDQNPTGVNAAAFISWFTLKAKKIIPFDKPAGKVGKEHYKRLWLETKRTWNIPNDNAEKYMMKNAVRNLTNFQATLVKNFVKKNLDPCVKYPYLADKDWGAFIARKTSKEFLVKSEKAKKSSSAKKFVIHLGRGGWKGAKKKQLLIWRQLEEKYEHLKLIENERSRKLIFAMAEKNKETGLYELSHLAIKHSHFLYEEEQKMKADGSYALNKEDPVVRLCGPEHPGRSRTVSSIIGSTQVHGGLFKNVLPTSGPVNCSSSFGFGGRYTDYPPILKMTECQLLLNVADMQLVVATGKAWPSSDRMMHTTQVHESCVKVHVNTIIDGYDFLPLYSLSKSDEYHNVGRTLHGLLQWPRCALVLTNNETPSNSVQRMDDGADTTTSFHSSQTSRMDVDDIATSTPDTFVHQHVDQNLDQENFALEEIASEILEASRTSKLDISSQELENFQDFHIMVKGQCIDPELPEDVRIGYYKLCIARKELLHDDLPEGLHYKLVAGMICEIVNIANEIKKCKVTVTKEEFGVWDNSLKSFEILGMKVGFLRERVEKLCEIVLELEGGMFDLRGYDVEKKHIEEELKDVMEKLVGLKERCGKMEGIVAGFKDKVGRHGLKFQEEVDAPW